MAQPRLFADTAILVTFDEGGGYYDSGYIEPVSFFGDGPRVPILVVSPYARAGAVDHSYADHVSVLKFIERNWRLSPLSERSTDNLPNPAAREDDPYVPANAPAIGDLMSLFDFEHRRDSTPGLP
jgi:phospholipase C